MTRPRHIVPGQLMFVTLSCVGRTMRFRPTKDVRQSIRCLFWHYAGRYGLQVHEFKVLGNHLHLLVTDVRGCLPDFMRDFGSHLSRQLNAIRGTTGTNLEKGYRVQLPTDDAKTFDHCVYTLIHGCKEGLVERADEWLGPGSGDLEYGVEVEFERPECGMWKKGGGRSRKKIWRSKGRAKHRTRSKVPERVQGMLVRPPILSELSDAELRAKIRDAVTKREDALIAERAEDGREVVGMDRVIARSYLSIPKGSRELFQTNPRVSGTDATAREEKLQELLEFERAYHDASVAFRSGQRDVEFPLGTWMMRRIYAANCAQAPP